MRATAKTWNLKLGMGLGLGLWSLFSQSALAEECKVDGDCGAGYVCSIQQGGACPAIACLPGQPCVDDCAASEYRSCEPAACSKNSDCPSDMLCHAFSTGCDDVTEAAPAPCAGDNCGAPLPTEPAPDCTVQTESYCTPRYELPCTTAADCGTGFRCVEEVAQWCSGSASVPKPNADGGVQDIAPPTEQCGETRTGNYVCELIEKTCNTDADCGGNFVCASAPGATVCSGSASTGSGGSTGSSGIATGAPAFAPPVGDAPASDAGIVTCTPSVASKVCLPRDYQHSSHGVDLDSNGTATSGGTKGESESPRAPQDDGTAKSGGGDGCSLRAGSQPSSSWLLMVASLIATVVYRRRTATRG